jgi:hypothetical protein
LEAAAEDELVAQQMRSVGNGQLDRIFECCLGSMGVDIFDEDEDSDDDDDATTLTRDDDIYGVIR